MKKLNWKDTAELIGMAAIVASLVFVGYQLRQDELIARTSLTSHTFELLTEIDLRMTDSELASIYAKILDDSGELTTEEAVKISSFLHAITGLFLRECHYVYRGIYDECDGIIRAYGSRYFGNSFAQSWWKINKPPSIDPAFTLPDWVDSEIESFGVESDKTRIDELKSSGQ
jgi:hypothetical protein